MSRHRHKKKPRKVSDPTGVAGAEDALYGRKSLRRRAVRVVVGVFLLPIALLVIAGGIGLYLFQGQEFSHSTIDNQVQASLQSVLGDAYKISIGRTGLSLISTSILSLNGKQVQILKAEDNRRIAVLDEVKIGIDPISIFTGSPRFDQLVVEGGIVDLARMGNANTNGGFRQALEGVGKQMKAASQAFADGTIDKVEISGLAVNGVKFGQRNTDNTAVNVRKALIAPDDNGGFAISGDLATRFSEFSVGGSWQQGDNGAGYVLSAGLGPLNSREWLAPADPLSALMEEKSSGFGLKTDFRADIRIGYDDALNPDAPYLKLQTEGGELRLGKGQTIPVNFAVANLRSDLALSKVEVERAEFSLGDITYEASGTATRTETQTENGKAWDIAFTFDQFSSSAPSWKNSSGEENLEIAGRFDPATTTLDLSSAILSDGPDSVLSARAAIKFAPETSAGIEGKATSADLHMGTLQKFWPFHVAPKFRTWLQTRLLDGRAKNLDVSFAIAEGRLKETAQGIGFREDEFDLKADVVGMTLETFGGLPPLQGASGSLAIKGSALSALVREAKLNPPGKGVVSVDRAEFSVADIFKPPVNAQLIARLGGSLPVVASLANAEPLKVADRLAAKPSSLSGEAVANIVVRFPLAGQQTGEAVDWKADIDLAGASSSELLFGQTIRNGDIKINATPYLVKAAGKANANGFDVAIDLAEPINGGPSSKRYRTLTTQVDHKVLAKQGIDISTVVNGRMAVTIKTDAKNNDRYEIDLKNADVSLPWISWLKGRGIPANASFILSRDGDINTLSDFQFSGSAFKASGRLSFDKAGLISAAMKKVVLVRGDSFDVDITRKGRRYVITANGSSFDGRSIINKVIHEDGIDGGSSDTDVSLTANFGRLGGFNSKIMENALVRYQTDKGWLTRLEVRGAQNGKLSKIDASRKGNTTTFNFASDNAGSALAIVDLYRKMEQGRLKARLVRNGEGPFTGKVTIKDFVVAGEERLKSLVAAPAEGKKLKQASGKLRELNVQRVKFHELKARIQKDENFFAVEKGRLRNNQIGLTFEGTIYDPKDLMSVRGTFMPLFAISRLIGGIPIIGDILSNGKNSGLIGITYRLKGAADNPTILVNPVSIIAPGIFKEIFQFQK